MFAYLIKVNHLQKIQKKKKLPFPILRYNASRTFGKLSLVIIPLIGTIKICIVSFQVASMSHLIKAPIFFSSRRNTNLLSTFKYAPGEFPKNFHRNHVIHNHVYYLFCLAQHRSSTVQWSTRSNSKQVNIGSNPTRDRLLYFYFLNFSGTFLAFTREVPRFHK